LHRRFIPVLDFQSNADECGKITLFKVGTWVPMKWSNKLVRCGDLKEEKVKKLWGLGLKFENRREVVGKVVEWNNEKW
jgi:hypothetical protein